MIGKVLAGRYRIVERIGGGGMALVYKAEDLQLGRSVAVKVLRGQFGSDEDFIRRFRREAQNAASLSHPNVVQIYDVGQEEDLYFIVMELVVGNTLKAVIQQQGPLQMTEAARIAGEVLGALAHAHTHRIVHRDIKPHNILIALDGRVKVTDFGIARATSTDTVTHTGSIMGSAHYFSPEQANGQPTTEKSDIYSVGIVLYETITGVVPFQGESPITVALKHLRDRPVPPSQLNSDVPQELDSIILKALEKEPEDRFASAIVMRQVLETFAADHAAGLTHMNAGDFPTMDLRDLKDTRVRREAEEALDRAAQSNIIGTRAANHVPDNRPHKRGLAWLWIAAIAVVVVGLLSAGGYALMKFLEVPTVQVPGLEGKTLLEAQAELKKLDLSYELLSEQHSLDFKEDTIIRTDPPGGTPVKKGRRILLVRSKGPDERTVPEVRGKTEDQARAMLENELLKVGQVDRRNSQEPMGTVIETVPASPTKLKAGSMVRMVISLGPLRVPPVTGKTLTEAQQLIASAGLAVGSIGRVADPKVPTDTVISSDPPQGTPVTQDRLINLVVSTGPPPTSKTFKKELTVPGEPGRIYDFKVTLVDTVGGVATESAPLFNGKKLAGEKVTVEGSFQGEAFLRVYVDNKEKARVDLP